MNKYRILLFATMLMVVHTGFSQFEFKFRNVGPLRGGRVTAVAGTRVEPGTFYLGATGGGVWKTTDYGTSWNNVSDGFFETPSIGALAVDQVDPNIVYAATGSDGLRSNVIAGKGVYKSIDGGETWEHIGLKNVGQIGAIIIHPDNHNIVYVAAVGQAFNANPERGIFKTTNGGKSWEKVLFISDKVGFSDVEFLPNNPSTLYAAAWKAERKPWNIISGGDAATEGGIYKSVDDGKSWEKLSEGLPSNLIGKIDVAVTPADSRIVYALVEAPEKEGGLYKSVDQGKTFKQVSDYSGIRTRPFYYTNLRVDPKNPDLLYALATGNYKSEDGGKNWKYLSPPHGDNHDLWINPDNPQLYIQSNDGGANVTFNGGESWSTQFNQPTSEIYQVEVDNQYPYWLYGGQQDNYSTIAVPSNEPYSLQNESGYIINTGGCETGPAVPNPENPNIVYSNCKGRFGVFDKTTGEEKGYYVGASYMYGHNPKDLKLRFQRVSPIHVSPHDAGVVYHTSQYVHRTKDEGVTWETISPDLTAFEEDKQVISGTPITRDITGEEYYSTIYAIRESTAKKGVIWTGANDGPIYVTQNDGATWQNVTPPKVPKGGRVDAVEPSPHDPAKAYACILRYQLGDWKPYIVKTTNYGKSWELITNGIPSDYPVRVVREDPKREGLLFAGTEYGLFVSYDDGANWESFQNNLPVTPITDIKLHRNDLVLSTMGRGFWILDNVSVLQQYDPAEKLAIYSPEQTIRYRMRSYGDAVPDFESGSVLIDFFLPEKTKQVKLEILDEAGTVVNTFFSDTTGFSKDSLMRDMSTNDFILLVDKSLSGKKGHNRYAWDMQHYGPWSASERRRYSSGSMVAPGKYTARITAGEETAETSFELVLDPRAEKGGMTQAIIEEQIAFSQKVRDLLSEARQLEADLEKKVKDKAEDADHAKETLKQLQAEDITYPMPKLIDQINYLYRMTVSTDQIMGKDAIDRYEELKKQFEELKQ
ncbi:WD40/YVTN/BNR-like repeat-containing protein [Marinoscillum pacificum]|uniref:WD40/YVTN/BNR-like repeat-containing protein n=1 Tax=Marinoscillum pacificum TaxID=392723 RepID=UPI00215761BD|nr:hypothetical protein [Marinoscillum pacificum]